MEFITIVSLKFCCFVDVSKHIETGGLYWQPFKMYEQVRGNRYAVRLEEYRSHGHSNGLEINRFATEVGEPNYGVPEKQCGLYTIQHKTKLQDALKSKTYTTRDCYSKAYSICTKPPASNSVFYSPFTNLCEADPFGGDLECDFESPLWDRGHCNWGYTISSTKRLSRDFEIPDGSKGFFIPRRWAIGNHHLQLNGIGFVELIGRTVLTQSCSLGNDLHEIIKNEFGFMFRKTNGTSIRVLKKYNLKTDGLLLDPEVLLDLPLAKATDGKWEQSLIDKGLCQRETIPYQLVIELNSVSETGSISLDDIYNGPCTVSEGYDFQRTGLCYSAIVDSEVNFEKGAEMCSTASIRGVPSGLSESGFVNWKVYEAISRHKVSGR